MVKKMKISGRLIFGTLLFAVLLPLLNIILLGSLSTVLSADVAFPAVISEGVSYIQQLIGVGCVFAAAACIAAAELKRRSERAVAAICLVSPAILYLASAAVDIAFWGSELFAQIPLAPLFVNCLFETARFAVIIAVCRAVRKSSAKSERADSIEFFSMEGGMSRAAVFSSLAIFVTLIVTALTDTLSLLAEFGAPQNAGEVVYLALPYLTASIYAFLGYLLICFTAKRLEK